PAVQFSTAGVVAGGTPAAGYALISGGLVTGIVITDPGTYTSGTVVTVTLTGGGGAIAPFATTSLTTANLAAGLTSSGTGTLTLTAANTFTGNINSSTAGGTVAFGNTVTQTVANLITGPGNIAQTGVGNTTLGAINTYTGSTTLTAGTLTVADLENGTVNSTI